MTAMGGVRKRPVALAVLSVTLAAALGAGRARAADPTAFNGLWILDEKASRDFPKSAKGVSLRVSLKGKIVTVQREFDGAKLGEATVLALDGIAVDRELGDLGRGTIEGRWIMPGKLYEQIVRAKKAVVPIMQTTSVTLSDDGRTMTRVQVTKQAGDESERVMVYRKRD